MNNLIMEILSDHAYNGYGKGNNIIESATEPKTGLRDGVIWHKNNVGEFYVYASGKFRPLVDYKFIDDAKKINEAKTTRRRNKDDEGIFLKVTKEDSDKNIAMTSTLYNKDSNGNYLNRSIEYGKPGTKEYKKEVYKLLYDSDGDYVDEVLQ